MESLNPPETTCQNSTERQFQFSSLHSGGCRFVFVDGSTTFISQTIDTGVFRALLTRGGGEIGENL